MRKRNRKQNSKRIKTVKDTLVIIGNGFDRWQGLQTSYSQFQDYYMEHRDEIMRKLHIKKKSIYLEEGEILEVSDVELIYGDPLYPGELDAEFWNMFEASLGEIDAERINLFFGKERRGLRALEKSIRNANRILREAFCGWIASITIEEKNTKYHFGENCIFINFNYTDTLQKRFQVPEENIMHIHGEATDKNSIVFGHSIHPQLPEEMLYRLGGRFRGLYYVDKILYETDKHVQDNIHLLCMWLALSGVMKEEIKDIYVLGHSMSRTDIEYFAFLADATRVHIPNEELEEEVLEDIAEEDPMEVLHNRLQYVINTVGYNSEGNEVNEEQAEAVKDRFQQEQEERNQAIRREFYKMVGYREDKMNVDVSEFEEPVKRVEDARWHISCFSEDDKQWIDSIMSKFKCTNFQLYSTIDECLIKFERRS